MSAIDSAIRKERGENERITGMLMDILDKFRNTGVTYDQCLLIRELMYWSYEKGMSDKRIDQLQTHELLTEEDDKNE